MLQGPLEQVSNRATWELPVRFVDVDTGELIDLTGLTIVCQLCPLGETGTVTLRASSIPGDVGTIDIVELGVALIVFPASAMRVCAPSDYGIGITAKTDDTDIEQPYVGSISIIEGVVTNP